jgi:uncharacterized membrane protein
MLKRLMFLLVLMTAGSASAQAAELCNETSYVVHVAAGWPVAGGVAIQGWERIRPSECAEMATDVDLDSDQPIYYYAKTSPAYPGGVHEWRGQISLCVDEADFEVVANTRCAALGLASREFMVREGDDRDSTTLVEPQGFDRRALDAGIQRLLQSAGYSIATVDGYEGPGTRRAVASFLSDAGLSSRPSDAELIDALEARAMERNAHSGLTICNQSGSDISAAVGHRVDDIWQSRGWWRMHTGECARLLATRLETANTYFYAERINSDARQALQRGDDGFCIAPARFLAEGRENCSDRAYGSVQFRRIPDPQNGGVRVTLTDDDFEGLQR